MWTAVTDVGLLITSSLRYAGSKAFTYSFSICYLFIMSGVDVFMCLLIVCCVTCLLVDVIWLLCCFRSGLSRPLLLTELRCSVVDWPVRLDWRQTESSSGMNKAVWNAQLLKSNGAIFVFVFHPSNYNRTPHDIAVIDTNITRKYRRKI